jgi:hypothetical protein
MQNQLRPEEHLAQGGYFLKLLMCEVVGLQGSPHERVVGLWPCNSSGCCEGKYALWDRTLTVRLLGGISQARWLNIFANWRIIQKKNELYKFGYVMKSFQVFSARFIRIKFGKGFQVCYTTSIKEQTWLTQGMFWLWYMWNEKEHAIFVPNYRREDWNDRWLFVKHQFSFWRLYLSALL